MKMLRKTSSRIIVQARACQSLTGMGFLGIQSFSPQTNCLGGKFRCRSRRDYFRISGHVDETQTLLQSLMVC